MTVLPDDVAERLAAFAAAWTALSRLLLRPPSQADLDAVRDPALLAVWPLARDAATAEGLRLLADSTEDADAVRRDHNLLFVGPGPLAAAPYESVQRGEERLLFDEQTLEVRAWYARYGLAAPRLNREPDDHVGLELEFLARLAQLALDRPEDAARVTIDLGDFLAGHVAAWVPGLADLVVTRAETGFHRGVARLLAGTVAQSVAVFAPSGAHS